jgi:hypothetical protein
MENWIRKIQTRKIQMHKIQMHKTAILMLSSLPLQPLGNWIA